jgi:putative spermidine/putrescine transport system substrate-binding protein
MTLRAMLTPSLCILPLLLSIAGAGAQTAASAPKTGELAVVSWGGSYQDAQRQAYFDPFAKVTGVKVIEGTGPEIARTRAEVESGHPSFDLVSTNQAFNLVGQPLHLWVPIDYRYFDPQDLAAMPQSERQATAVGTIVYSEAMAINTDGFKNGAPAPASWKDFWDTKDFPQRRALPWCDLSQSPLPEAALMADGVPLDNLYPLDIDRAARKLAELKDKVVWVKNNAQASQLLASGEVAMAMSPNGRVQTLIDKGAPLRIIWSQGRYTSDVWYVLKGAANVDNAMRFIAFASRPEQQAKMAELTGNGPTNPRAFALIDAATMKKLPNAPENLAHQVHKDETWWKDNREKWVAACTAALM